MLRARRTDGLVALMQAQLAQERFRANNAGYGSLAESACAATSAAGHYTVAVVAPAARPATSILATRHRQRRRATPAAATCACAWSAPTLVYASGADATVANAAAANRSCWSR